MDNQLVLWIAYNLIFPIFSQCRRRNDLIWGSTQKWRAMLSHRVSLLLLLLLFLELFFFLSKLPNIPPKFSAQQRAMVFQAFKTQQPLLEQNHNSSEAPVLHGCLQAEGLPGVASVPPSSCPGTAKPSAFQKMFLGTLSPCCWSIMCGKGREVAFFRTVDGWGKCAILRSRNLPVLWVKLGSAYSVGWARVWLNKK